MHFTAEPCQNTQCSFGIDSCDSSLLKQHNGILDCPAGALFFVIETNRLSVKVVGCDPVFGASLKSLVKRGKEDTEFAPHLYNWNFYKSIGALREYRTLALRRYTSDYCKGILEKRYVKAALPKLPFDDKSFDLVLSGHFLFTHADKFDFDFHLSSILNHLELVAKK